MFSRCVFKRRWEGRFSKEAGVGCGSVDLPFAFSFFLIILFHSFSFLLVYFLSLASVASTHILLKYIFLVLYNLCLAFYDLVSLIHSFFQFDPSYMTDKKELVKQRAIPSHQLENQKVRYFDFSIASVRHFYVYFIFYSIKKTFLFASNFQSIWRATI